MVNFNSLKLNGIIATSGKKKKDVADMLGVHQNTVSNWTTGNNKPDPEQLTALLVGIGYTADELKNERLIDWYPMDGSNGSTP